MYAPSQVCFLVYHSRVNGPNNDRDILPAPGTIGECKQAVASLIIIDSAFLLSKNKDISASLYKIKSERFKERLKN